MRVASPFLATNSILGKATVFAWDLGAHGHPRMRRPHAARGDDRFSIGGTLGGVCTARPRHAAVRFATERQANPRSVRLAILHAPVRKKGGSHVPFSQQKRGGAGGPRPFAAPRRTRSKLSSKTLHGPALAICLADKTVRLGFVRDFNRLRVPMQCRHRKPFGEAAEPHRFRQRPRVIKRCRRLPVAATRLDILR